MNKTLKLNMKGEQDETEAAMSCLKFDSLSLNKCFKLFKTVLKLLRSSRLELWV